ncbi:TonB-dependent receptor [Novosphingobium sp. 9]|uniref:TonB-dependent receptor n=1 Tax=Novosphingobium sp. 9 TaxID=2025349 RepID=UPI0021B5F7BE|nr:TonB-dependent receptor [Novosphingobium sp. 9]
MISRYLNSTGLAGHAALSLAFLAGALAATPASAQTASDSAAAKATADAQDPNAIVVTATKRNETIQSVPLAISAVTQAQFLKSGAQSLSDYITRLPGVQFNDYQPGISEVVIRGISTTTYHDQGQPTVGYYLNQIPLTEPGFPIALPDVDTFDLERVEVLRGPQGTLFGASTLGGLVNYVVNTADASKYDAAAEGLIGTTKHNNGNVNYAIKGMINVPVIKDTLAVRLMAFQRYDSGYIDNVDAGVKAANDLTTRGYRGSVVFTPAPDTKISYLIMHQETSLADQTYANAGSLSKTGIYTLEPQHTNIQIHSLRLDQGLGDFADLTVIGALDKKSNDYVYSYAAALPLADTTHAVGNAKGLIRSIEARLTSKGNGPLSWMIGTSYMVSKRHTNDYEYQAGAEDFVNANPDLYDGISGSVIAPGDQIYGYYTTQTAKDFGIFGEVSYAFLPSLKLTLGGRYYNTSINAGVTNAPGTTYADVDAGYATYTATTSSFSVNQKEDGFTPKVTLSYRPDQHLMVYATYSQGFRVGGANPNAAILTTLPRSYGSDKVYNYEIGARGTLLGGRLTTDLTLFRMDWKNMQVREFYTSSPYYSYVINAGGARSQGVEFAASLQALPQLALSTSVTYDDAKVTTFVPYDFAANGLGGYAAGTRLPGSSPWMVANTVTVTPMGVKGPLRIELAHRYESKAPTTFDQLYYRGGFNQFDLRAAYQFPAGFTLTAFANNIFNKYAILDEPFAPYASILRPRTIGLRLDWSM